MQNPTDTFTSNKPYLFKAIFEWLLDNDATPYLHVDTTHDYVDVPQEHVKDNQIVLNISPTAVQNWSVDQNAISFNARFSGIPRDIYIPMSSVVAIYAKENGLGMVFPEEEPTTSQSTNSSEQTQNAPTPVEVTEESIDSGKVDSDKKNVV